ncbi:MAG: peptidoglycan-binding protein [Candidatus Omnitrophota bacterium]
MIVRIGMVSLLAFVVSGCTTTNYQSSINFLQMRLGQLESQLLEKDREIQELKTQMAQVVRSTQKTEQRKKVGEEQQKSGRAKSGKDSDVLRVAVSAEKVQEALKKAGFYDGDIDGKIGANTQKAIVELQKSNGLKADGIIGQKTWEIMEQYLE